MPLSFLPHDSHSTARLRGRGEGQVELEQVTWTDQEELAGEQPVEAPVTVQKEGMPLSFEELPATDPRYQGKPDFEVPVNNVLGDQRAQNGSRMGSSGIEGRSGNPKPTYGLKGVGKARILEPQGTAHREPTLEEGLQGMRDLAPVDWSLEHKNSYQQLELQTLLGEPLSNEMRTTIWELCTTVNENWLDTLIASFFQEGPRPGFDGAVFRRKRITGAWPTFEEILRTTNENPETKALRAVRCMMVGQGDVERLLLADKHLLSQSQYSMLGFRLYVLLKGISEIALRPIQLVAAEVTGTEQHSLLE
jgi:hypothetical protein